MYMKLGPTIYTCSYSVHDAHEEDPWDDGDDDVVLRNEALTSDEEDLLADVVVHALRHEVLSNDEVDFTDAARGWC